MSYEKQPNRLARSTRIYSRPCVKCEKDTPHKGQACIFCGSPVTNPFAYSTNFGKARRQIMSFRRMVIESERRARYLSSERSKAFQRAAEESRKKWEGA